MDSQSQVSSGQFGIQTLETNEPYKKMHLNKTLRTIPKVRCSIVEGSLEVKLPTIWRDEKQSREVESEDGRYRCAKVRRKKIQSCKMLGKSRIAVFFQ